MDKKNKTAAAVFAAVIIVCAAVTAVRGIQKNRTAVIYLDGDIVREINLDTLSEPIEFDIHENGHTNRVRAERGRIRMQSADCPDKICVDQGWISSGAVPIVCLPHKIIIEIKGGSGGVDAVAGGM